MVCELWADPTDLCCDITAYSQQQIDDAILASSQILSEYTNNRFGVCEQILRFCSCECPTSCCCEQTFIPLLTSYDLAVQTIVDVKIYDSLGVETIVSNMAYRLVGNRLIVNDLWTYGFMFDVNAPLGAPNTAGITVMAGEPIPMLGRMAASDLACYLLKTYCVDADCGLPSNVTQVTRDGVSYKIDANSWDIDSVNRFLKVFKPAKWSGIAFSNNFLLYKN